MKASDFEPTKMLTRTQPIQLDFIHPNRRAPVTWLGASRFHANEVDLVYSNMAALVIGAYAVVNKILFPCEDDDDDLVVFVGTAGMLFSVRLFFFYNK